MSTATLSPDRRGVAGPSRDPVVVTGIGVVMPGATTVDRFWANLRDGHSQVGRIEGVDTTGTPIAVAAQLGDLDLRAALPDIPDAHAKKYSREIMATMCAVQAARTDAGVADAVDPTRTGLIDSSSRGPIEFWSDRFRSAHGGYSDARVQGDEMLVSLPGTPATFAAIRSGIQGTVTTVSGACVGGNHALSVAVREIQSGAADAMFVGGHEFPLVPEILRLYSAPGRAVLSRGTGSTAMRPYDRDRDGFVLGEGAVVLCVERAATARARGARVYAEVLGHRHLNEAHHPTRMDLSGAPTAAMIGGLLDDIGRRPEDVGYICGHGTATRYNDVAESRALGLLYDRLGLPRPPLGSVKPVYGHLFGAGSLVNLAATTLMLHHQTLAPTLNCVHPDPECDHDHVAEGSRRVDLELALSLSFAMGSQSSVVALGRAR